MEIGSEFWDMPIQEGRSLDIPKNSHWLLSGRTALDHIIKDILYCHRDIVVYMPAYCCEAMLVPFLNHEIRIKTYPVIAGSKGLELQYDYNNDCNVVFLINYFGFVNDDTALIARRELAAGKIVIYDEVQAYFSNTDVDATYRLMSFRKWFANDAALAMKSTAFLVNAPETVNDRYEKLRMDARRQKKQYMSKAISDKKVYLDLFARAENILNGDYCDYASINSEIKNALYCDFDLIRSKRRKNAEYLISEINQMQGLAIRSVYPELRDGDCPLMIPIIVKDNGRDSLCEYMKSQNIYCPIHWPFSKYHKECGADGDLYRSELSLVCDQRYGLEDMQRIIKTIREWVYVTSNSGR